jgi:hypothetical protein
MTDDQWIALIFGMFIILGIGIVLGSYAQSFTIPSCKIWESNRTYDHILIADNVICKPANEVNATYWRYDTVQHNGTEYLVQKTQVSNSTAKGMIICR